MKVVSDRLILVMLGVASVEDLKQTTGELPGVAVQSIPVVVVFTTLTEKWRTDTGADEVSVRSG